MTLDLSGYTMAELDELAAQVATEKDNRLILASADDQINQILAGVQRASGRTPGSDWAQPTGAHDAYPAGAEVAYGGKRWVSLSTANVWTPGVSGWREIPDPNAGPPAWVQPTGAHDAYATGDRVTYGGKTWRSTAAANVWAPGVYGWEEVI
jgi:hypothetical protein